MAVAHPRADVLGRLLVALQTLDILPGRESMAAFLDRALVEVPGVASVRMLAPDDCWRDTASFGEDGGESAIDWIPMGTPRGNFGCLQLNVDDPHAYAHYRSFLLNLGHMLATVLENRENSERLADANRQLNTLVGDLERRVDERTRRILEDQEKLMLSAKVFDCSAEGIIITDAEQRILTVNRSFVEITGYTLEEVVGKTPRVLRSGQHDKTYYQHMWSMIESSGQWQGEIWNRRRNGEFYPEWLSISSVSSGSGAVTHYVGIFSDITERKQAEERLQFLAHHDTLTELPNRLLFRDRFDCALARAVRERSRLAVLFLDLDGFKQVNDSLGHRGGDIVLQSVARRLIECLRKSDTVARHGGDEFLILIPDLRDRTTIDGVATKLLDRIGTPYTIEGDEIYLSASLGIALFPEDGTDFTSLMRNADIAMYQAKEAGRNTYRFFRDSMNAGAVEYLALRSSLRRALAEQEFELYYQPQVDLDSGAVVGAEALLRWIPKGAEPIPPLQFIPVAEASGLIVPIGEWVIEQACRDAAEWQRRGLPAIVVAANLSAIQFRRGNLEQTVARALEHSGLSAECLELEFTESILIQDNDMVLATVRSLKTLGLSLAIDDFGTGYSSLAYLKRFNVDKLKIDQSFIRNLSNDPENQAIVGAIVQMARSLGLRTVAEGVETEGAVAALRRLHCREVQGYLFAKPMPAEEFAGFLAASGSRGSNKSQQRRGSGSECPA